MGVNRGKFFDARLTAEYFDGMKSSVAEYTNGASDAHMSFATFRNEPTFQGKTATSTKEFINGAVGGMLTELTDVKDQMVRNQNYVMEAFERIVDSSRNARIEFDTLERLNSDFKGFYRAFVDHAKEVDRLVEGLNSEFGSYAYFEKPNKSSAISGFETICGGDSEGSGHFRRCQNKLAEFDDAMRSYLRGTDVVDHTDTMDRRINNAASVRGSFKPQETQLNNIQVEHVLYNGNEAVAMGAGVAASMAGMFFGKKESLGTDPFDDKGQYGGNQGGPDRGEVWFGKWVVGEDKELFKFIKQHPGYENYSDMQIRELLQHLNDTGCTYVAATNSIFNSYQGREKEFEKTFGFPMVGKNGDLNYDMLLLDYYIATKDRVYLDGPEGHFCFMASTKNFYEAHPEKYKEKYGEELYDSNGEVTDTAISNMYDEATEAEKKGIKTVRFYEEYASTTPSSIKNRLTHYCEDKDIDVQINYEGNSMSNDDIKKALDDGKTVLFGSVDFDLEYENGKKVNGDPIGGHRMTITGITPDGRYEVSSWGEKYYFDPNDNASEMEMQGFYTIEYNLSDE